MANIRMSAPIANGNYRLPDGVTVTVSGGYASVPDTSWLVASQAGFAHDDATKANIAPFILHQLPASWPQNGSVTAPDNTAITITAGKALIPIAWVNYYRGFGFLQAQ